MTELEQRAAEAWALMAREPNVLTDWITGATAMPANVALDFVQEATGDRDDAVTALLQAAATWLEAKMPADDSLNYRPDAFCVVGDIRGEDFSHADSMIGTIDWRARGAEMDRLMGMNAVSREQMSNAFDWRHWCVFAWKVIILGRAIVAAAYPEPV
jgi:hypothetical protein